MILSAQEIKKAVALGEIKISPFDEKNLKDASYTFTLGNKFKKLKQADFLDTRADKHEFDEFVLDEKGYLLKPGEFLILSSKESISLGDTIACFLTMRGKELKKDLTHSQVPSFVNLILKGDLMGLYLWRR